MSQLNVNSDDESAQGLYRYQIRVNGTLDPQWSEWFHGLEILCTGGQTTLQGPVVDQPRLRGILNKLWDLNLDVIHVSRLTGTQGE